MLNLLIAATAITAAALTTPSFAVPIPVGSTLNVTGNATFTANTIAFTTPAGLGAGTGAYTALGTCSGCVTMTTPFIFAPFNASPLASATNLGNTATVAVTSQIVAPSISANVLTIQDNASLTLTNFDTTPGHLFLTVNQATGAISGSFSATAEPVATASEPASLLILGIGVLGLAYVARNRNGGGVRISELA
jgi:hypothetical protein